jgi:hypothetical protein
LRTLLAYLDDTLQAAEIKEIGQKVAESDAAQELIARIKAVTRRRRLTAPPLTGPNGMDPNSVSEYLDNELPSEELGDLEKVALESDVHLAEIAACHQILTLVLGEPALVPPTARERMYGLVHGREAIPFRKAAPVKKGGDSRDDEEIGSLAGDWLKWVLPAAGLLLVIALGLAIYQILPPRERQPVAKRGAIEQEEDKDRSRRETEKDKEKGKKGSSGDVDKDKDKDKDKTTTPVKDKDKSAKDGGEKDGGKPVKNGETVERPDPPAAGRVAAGNYVGSFAKDLPSVLLSKQAEGDSWQRVSHGASIQTADTLMALPGYNALIRTSKGASILLRGHVRDLALHPLQELLAETAVQLHKNDKFDLDMTLLRGRVYLRNRKDKGPLKVRLRFESEVWDLSLADQTTEVGLDLAKAHAADIDYRADEEPRAGLWLCLLNGDLELKVDAFNTWNLEVERPRAVVLPWDSFTRTGTPQRIDKVSFIWDKQPPAAGSFPEGRRADVKLVTAALKNLEVLLADKRKPVDIALKETLGRDEIASRVLAVYCLGAIDDASKLIDVLGDENPDHWIDRSAAIYTLRRWLSRGAGQGKLLYDSKTKTGILRDKMYKPREAETIFDLLHDFRPSDWRKAETFEALALSLQHKRVAIAELGFYHLVQLSPGVKLPPGFNAAAPLEDRERYATRIQEMIAKRKLPPPPPEPPAKKPDKGE